jgi:hypothetical protein
MRRRRNLKFVLRLAALVLLGLFVRRIFWQSKPAEKFSARVFEEIDTLLGEAVLSAFRRREYQDLWLHLNSPHRARFEDCFLPGTGLLPSFCLSPSPILPASSTLRSTNTLCALFAGQTVLFVGPEATYHLHNLLLHALSNRSFPSTCLGAEFCTWHHICHPSSSSFPTTDNERFKQPPSRSRLISTRTALIRYVLSHTLHASANLNRPRYTHPFVDPNTGVRMKDGYWIGRAKSTGVQSIVLGRAPVPAPAWTYDGQRGNWSFVDSLPTTLSSCSSKNCRIVNAAIHATLTEYLPSILRTISTIKHDWRIKNKNIIWHGSWYMRDCSSLHEDGRVSLDEDYLRHQISLKGLVDDPWNLYYNAQGAHTSGLRLLSFAVLILSRTPPLSSAQCTCTTVCFPSSCTTFALSSSRCPPSATQASLITAHPTYRFILLKVADGQTDTPIGSSVRPLLPEAWQLRGPSRIL